MPKSLPPRLRLGLALVVVALLGAAPPAVPDWLPRYELGVRLDVAGQNAEVVQRVTFTNRHDAPVTELVFNVHSHFEVPSDEVGKLAKTLELLRLSPSDNMDFDGPPIRIDKVNLTSALRAKEEHFVQQGEEPPPVDPVPLKFHWRENLSTALVVPLPAPVSPGESVTVELSFHFRLPQKQGRWGQWEGITFLSNWLPVLAVYDDKNGWQPTPFVPWHQPWFNEAGVYAVRLTLPSDQKVASSGTINSQTDLGNGWKQLELSSPAARDFAILASAKYVELEEQVGPTKVRVLALPEHLHYAQAMMRMAAYALPAYSEWFGPYPYPQFTIAESYFGWNGNECSGLVMIDERVFAAPHLAEGFVEYLVSHEICHQWWYNTVGTNGYAETWMDEGPAVYFSHRLMNCKRGKNNNLLQYPKGLCWLPNIYRENYRHYGLYGTIGRGDNQPVVQNMDKFGHVVNLFSMTYDKGSKIVGMIEDRLGEAAFIDFMRRIYSRYYFKVLRVADFQKELEEYTGQSWEPFFKDWLYGKGLSDWAVEKVWVAKPESCLAKRVFPAKDKEARTWRTTIVVQQKGEYCEPTVIGVCLKDDGCCYQMRIPVIPNAQHVVIDNPPAIINGLPGNRVEIIVDLPAEPKQIAIDPDQVLVDRDPSNNYWKCWYHWRVTPLYTFLDENDLTNDYDKWNFIAGPWAYFPPTYNDPWFNRSALFGARASAYRTQQFYGGVFAAYRYEYRDTVIGADAMWDHWPWPRTQFGFALERRLDAAYEQSDNHANRAVLYGRYVFNYSSSLYLPPMQYLEIFTTWQNNFLPQPDTRPPAAERYSNLAVGGLHYHLDYLTPYWDPEGGFAFDAVVASGQVSLGKDVATHQTSAQFAMVKALPEWLGPLAHTRVAARAYGAAALPTRGEFYTLGGDQRFRGYNLADRQGSVVWVGSLEWRVPVVKGLTFDCVDHIFGLRNIYVAAFYDVGNAYINGHQVGPTAHALGGGLRLDVAWFSFVERSILRVDLAKTVNDDTPMQVWLGVQHPF